MSLAECMTCKKQEQIFSFSGHFESCSSRNNASVITTFPDDSKDYERDLFDEIDDSNVSDMTRMQQNAEISHSSLSLPRSSKSQPGRDIFSSNLPRTLAQCWMSDLKVEFADEDDKKPGSNSICCHFH